MFVSKEINVMKTDKLTPGVEWCNEAYENADVIIYDNSYFKREYYAINGAICFISITVLSGSIIFKRMTINKGVNNINLQDRNINIK